MPGNSSLLNACRKLEVSCKVMMHGSLRAFKNIAQRLYMIIYLHPFIRNEGLLFHANKLSLVTKLWSSNDRVTHFVIDVHHCTESQCLVYYRSRVDCPRTL